MGVPCCVDQPAPPASPHLASPSPAPPRFTSLLLFSLRFALVYFAFSLVLVLPHSFCSYLASFSVISLIPYIPPSFSISHSDLFRLASPRLSLQFAFRFSLLASSRFPSPEPVGLTFQVYSSAAPTVPRLTLLHPIVLYTTSPHTGSLHRTLSFPPPPATIITIYNTSTTTTSTPSFSTITFQQERHPPLSPPTSSQIHHPTILPTNTLNHRPTSLSEIHHHPPQPVL